MQRAMIALQSNLKLHIAHTHLFEVWLLSFIADINVDHVLQVLLSQFDIWNFEAQGVQVHYELSPLSWDLLRSNAFDASIWNPFAK